MAFASLLTIPTRYCGAPAQVPGPRYKVPSNPNEPSPTLKTLLVLRHAKSDWNAQYGSDHDRPLNPRGVEAAARVGSLVSDLGLVPDLVISSTALRARATAELAIEAGGWETVLELTPDFYHSGVDGTLDVVSRVDAADRLMIVGHQPTWGLLVVHLTGVPAEIKTATLAVVALPLSAWDQIGDTPARLVGLHHPAEPLQGVDDRAV